MALLFRYTSQDEFVADIEKHTPEYLDLRYLRGHTAYDRSIEILLVFRVVYCRLHFGDG